MLTNLRVPLPTSILCSTMNVFPERTFVCKSHAYANISDCPSWSFRDISLMSNVMFPQHTASSRARWMLGPVIWLPPRGIRNVATSASSYCLQASSIRARDTLMERGNSCAISIIARTSATARADSTMVACPARVPDGVTSSLLISGRRPCLGGIPDRTGHQCSPRSCSCNDIRRVRIRSSRGRFRRCSPSWCHCRGSPHRRGSCWGSLARPVDVAEVVQDVGEHLGGDLAQLVGDELRVVGEVGLDLARVLLDRVSGPRTGDGDRHGNDGVHQLVVSSASRSAQPGRRPLATGISNPVGVSLWTYPGHWLVVVQWRYRSKALSFSNRPHMSARLSNSSTVTM